MTAAFEPTTPTDTQVVSLGHETLANEFKLVGAFSDDQLAPSLVRNIPTPPTTVHMIVE
jgi:hypothetical protein